MLVKHQGVQDYTLDNEVGFIGQSPQKLGVSMRKWSLSITSKYLSFGISDDVIKYSRHSSHDSRFSQSQESWFVHFYLGWQELHILIDLEFSNVSHLLMLSVQPWQSTVIAAPPPPPPMDEFDEPPPLPTDEPAWPPGFEENQHIHIPQQISQHIPQHISHHAQPPLPPTGPPPPGPPPPVAFPRPPPPHITPPSVGYMGRNTFGQPPKSASTATQRPEPEMSEILAL